jgi:hypothetical protein
MKNSVLLLLVGVLSSLSVYSQTSTDYFEYKYDEAGNRTLREYSFNFVVTTDTVLNKLSDLIDDVVVSVDTLPGTNESFSDSTKAVSIDESFQVVAVFPNPTYGELKIDMLGFSSSGFVKVFDSNGRLILESDLRPDRNIIDMRDLTKGRYVVYVQSEGYSKQWQIVKQ